VYVYGLADKQLEELILSLDAFETENKAKVEIVEKERDAATQALVENSKADRAKLDEKDLVMSALMSQLGEAKRASAKVAELEVSPHTHTSGPELRRRCEPRCCEQRRSERRRRRSSRQCAISCAAFFRFAAPLFTHAPCTRDRLTRAGRHRLFDGRHCGEDGRHRDAPGE